MADTQQPPQTHPSHAQSAAHTAEQAAEKAAAEARAATEKAKADMLKANPDGGEASEFDSSAWPPGIVPGDVLPGELPGVHVGQGPHPDDVKKEEEKAKGKAKAKENK